LQQPFTIAVSGLGGDSSVLWQGGLADLYLRTGSPCWARGSLRPSAHAQALKYGQPSKEGAGVTKRPKKDATPAKTGKTRKPKPKKKTARGK
jgi:hypothetical protein